MDRLPRGIVINERCERLLAVCQGNELSDALLERANVSLIRAHHPRGLVLVLNATRGVWELPGGYIDPGETAVECALRELQEESGLVGSGVVLEGAIRVERSDPNAGVFSCVLYSCQVSGDPNVSCREVLDVAFWRPGVDIGPISAIDAFLLRWGLREFT